jgi:hypothetical protein
VEWVFVVRVLPSFEAYKPAPELAELIDAHAQRGDLIVTYNVALPSLVYYLRRHTDVFYDHGPVLNLVRENRPMFLMVSDDDYARAIKPVVGSSLCQIAALPTFEVKLRNILAREQRPVILLMTNRCSKDR